MRNNKRPLSHHEELRLDYLQKNIHFLNDKEKRELAFLNYKDQYGAESASLQSWQLSSYEEEQEIPIRGRKQFLDDDVEDLPEYPRERPSRSRARKAEKKSRPKAVRVPKEVEMPTPPQPKVKKPRKKGRVKRFFKWLAFLLLTVLAGMGFMFYKGMKSIQDNPNAKAAETEVFHGKDTKDGVNILVLGTDGRVGETSDMTRTDSVMVVNINNSEKKVKIVSFMRDTLINIDGNDYKLNVVYTFGEQNNHQGAENVREVLKENFDIDIKHYALVDFSTFATAIDTIFPEGVTIDAQFSTIDGVDVSAVDVPDDLNMKDGVVPNQTITEGKQKMDGRTLLNYARFRKDDEGDYGRTRRQQQVLSAVLTQVKNPTKLFTGSEALGKVYSLTSTSIPFSFILTNGLGATVDGANGVSQTTIPENGDWTDEFDVYGGSGLKVDFEKYKQKLADMGFR
ncbi:LCP family protein required for cell wall assembly [Streptococcus gallinaceus]|uniref:LCP family protein n=1 Tax=Streptococcus gallinaceus TaxID=165758 RepID=UPI00209DF69D|nr:LCP family protein [Streptococcus gallinaceus]MCP1639143.1 LCP family protein required for cell wall assembly [Streptococcus gallinaceus]MCP1769613.1 LCP family protein required for cell wall assembly [Streptococcus gallinaceus]